MQWSLSFVKVCVVRQGLTCHQWRRFIASDRRRQRRSHSQPDNTYPQLYKYLNLFPWSYACHSMSTVQCLTRVESAPCWQWSAPRRMPQRRTRAVPACAHTKSTHKVPFERSQHVRITFQSSLLTIWMNKHARQMPVSTR